MFGQQMIEFKVFIRSVDQLQQLLNVGIIQLLGRQRFLNLFIEYFMKMHEVAIIIL